MTTVLYARISEDRSGLAAGVGRQVDDAEALAAARGWPVAERYVDNDISALNGAARPRYDAMMDAIRAGTVERIVIFKTSRLWRNRRERAEGIEVLRSARVSVVATMGPELDMTTAAGRMMAALLGEFDTIESENKAENVQRAALARAVAGRNHGGRRAYGYTADGLHLVPAEAAEVAGMFAAFLAGTAIAGICRDLGTRGVRTVGGRRWAPGTVREVLMRPRYAGLSEYHGQIVGAGQWPAVVTEETWRLTGAILRRPDRRTTTGNRAAYLLSGLARCGTCGGRITSGGRKANGSGGFRRMYRCQAGGHATRRGDWVDEYVTRVIVARLSRPDAVGLLVDASAPDFDALAEQARMVAERLEEIAGAFGDGEMTREQARTATERARARLALIERAQAHTSRAPVLAGLIGTADVRAAWDACGLDRQRAVVAALVSVTILGGGGGSHLFDPSKVRVEWIA